MKRAGDQLQAQKESHERAVALLATQEELMKRQQVDLDRYEKILDTWERQQKEYQQYLDKLDK